MRSKKLLFALFAVMRSAILPICYNQVRYVNWERFTLKEGVFWGLTGEKTVMNVQNAFRFNNNPYY